MTNLHVSLHRHTYGPIWVITTSNTCWFIQCFLSFEHIIPARYVRCFDRTLTQATSWLFWSFPRTLLKVDCIASLEISAGKPTGSELSLDLSPVPGFLLCCRIPNRGNHVAVVYKVAATLMCKLDGLYRSLHLSSSGIDVYSIGCSSGWLCSRRLGL